MAVRETRRNSFPSGSAPSEVIFSPSIGGSRPHAIGRRPPNQCSGFTLVELIIALAFVGLISLLLFSGLRLGTRAWEGVETLAERTAEPRIARDFLARALAQIRPEQVTFDGEQVLVFSGDAENLEFVAPLSEHVGIPGLYVLRLSLEEGERNRLVLTRWLLHQDVLDGIADVPEWEPFDGSKGLKDVGPMDEDLAAGAFGRTLLLEGVDEFEISYFGTAEALEEPDWVPEWMDKPELPQAVGIRLTTEEQTWPDILVRLPDSQRSAGVARR